jgi:CubicO group peptidase (beta-lactamase class C family)
MKKACIGAAAAIATALCLGQPTAGAQTNGPQLSASVSQARLSRIDALLQRYVDEGQIAGAVALVLKDGQPIYERAVGWSDREADRPMAVDTIFRIASQSKAITSAAILALVEEGRVGLNDPVSRFIPGFAKAHVSTVTNGSTTESPVKRPITIRDLLTHTAGISYGINPHIAAQYEARQLGPAAGYGWYLADKDEGVCDTMERLATLPFVAQPGEAFVYGYNTDVLGCVVERASGVSLDEFIRSRITRPLGMRDTQFFLPEDQRPRLAAVYAGANGKVTRAPEGSRGQGHYIEGPRRNFSGGAGLLSTARDYARFLEMLRRGGELDGARILAPRTVALMTTNQVGDLHSKDGLGFGLGFQTVERYGAYGMDAPGAFGWGGAYGTSYRVDPQGRMVMVLMIQLLPAQSDLASKFMTLVYQSLMEPIEPRHRAGG